MADDEVYRSVSGIREPDPTLGKKPRPLEVERPAVALSAGPPANAEGAEGNAKPRRKKVVLAEPRRSSSSSMRARVELAEQTSWEKLLVKDLVKVQLRAGLLLFGVVVVALGALPLLFHHLPQLATWRVIGLPVPWILLGVLPFPLLFGVGLWYNRLAERHERDFVAMIEN
ncbi:hypothetical protein [Saccharomonospora xinjiangensis]|uniref:DUF485 domain-containing protein n=1 Tax=Saccharomonospora xinjiangensis XJ-54 TaxID=882086 RepID=I0V257_9PSEU|nr:hypothetical protein [Saccharomonospora xinjiangensis]EID54210.1 hypothetical protein SacxiDRAFT_1973 [Saccharomonospora xinjiangensis XJ-54]